MDTIGIITTVGSYERFLPGWCDSIVGLNTQPDRVVVAAHNPTTVREHLRGFDAEVVHVEQEFQFGTYLNAAVERCDTDWVVWLGVDDRYRPHALDGLHGLAADVRVFGMRLSDGREWHGHPFDEIKQRNPVPCGSPFRRWIWDIYPFQPELAPYEDWAFWVGAYACGAICEPATEVHFDYAMHPQQIVPPHAPNAARIREWADQILD